MFAAFRHLPIKTKQQLVILLTSGLVLTLASVAFAVYEMFRVHQTMVTQMYTLADLVSFNSDVGLVFNDAISSEQSLEVLKVNIEGKDFWN